MTDFKKIIGKLCLDISYAIKFFENRELALAGCNLTLEEIFFLDDNVHIIKDMMDESLKVSNSTSTVFVGWKVNSMIVMDT
jgi:hypothetical protein